MFVKYRDLTVKTSNRDLDFRFNLHYAIPF